MHVTDAHLTHGLLRHLISNPFKREIKSHLHLVFRPRHQHVILDLGGHSRHHGCRFHPVRGGGEEEEGGGGHERRREQHPDKKPPARKKSEDQFISGSHKSAKKVPDKNDAFFNFFCIFMSLTAERQITSLAAAACHAESRGEGRDGEINSRPKINHTQRFPIYGKGGLLHPRGAEYFFLVADFDIDRD